MMLSEGNGKVGLLIWMFYKSLLLAFIVLAMFIQPLAIKADPQNSTFTGPPPLPENPGTLTGVPPDKCSSQNLDNIYDSYQKAEEMSSQYPCYKYLAEHYHYKYLRLKCLCQGGCDKEAVASYYQKENAYYEKFHTLFENGKCGQITAPPTDVVTTTEGASTPGNNSDPQLISTWVFPREGTGNQVYNYSVSLTDPDNDPVMVQLCIHVLDAGWQCFDALQVMGEGTASWNMTFVNATPGTYEYRIYYDDGNNRGAWGPYGGPVVKASLVNPNGSKFGADESNPATEGNESSTNNSDDVTGAVIVGVSAAAGVAIAKKAKGRRKNKEERGDEKSSLDQFTQSVEDANKWAGKTKPVTDVVSQAGAYSSEKGLDKGIRMGADSWKNAERKRIVKKFREFRNGKSVRQSVLRGGGKDGGGFWDPKKYKKLKRLGRRAVNLPKKYKTIKNLANKVRSASKFASKYIGAASIGLSTYDGVKSYNKYIDENKDFVKDHPIMGRALGAMKAFGEQVIIYTVTKNPVIGLPDAVIGYATNGRVSVARAIQDTEDFVSKGIRSMADAYYGNQYSDWSEGYANHSSIKKHLSMLNDPDYVRKLKARGWTDERIARVRKSMEEALGMR